MTTRNRRFNARVVLQAAIAIGVAWVAFASNGTVAIGQSPRLAEGSETSVDLGQPVGPSTKTKRAAQGTVRTNPLNAERAFEMLERICQIGPRISGSAGMIRQQEILTQYFEQLGGTVEMQPFTVEHPQLGKEVVLANMVVTWHPDRDERILLCAHYDTRPYPDQDPRFSNRRKPFIGANDGASGVALLAELAHHISDIESPLGIDFVLFDAEEFVYNDRRDRYFLGSEYFATRYRDDPPDHRYRYAVLVDMVGDKQLGIYQERHSLSWPDSRPLVRDIWMTAKDLGVREFVARPKYEVRDDHLALHNIARIPSCDIIDFDYPRPPKSRGSYWHTTMDTPDKCSGESLAKVGWVILEWFKRLQ